MIDFHSHVLPGIDDGASNVETSLEMLRICKLSGVDTVVSTSHCYPYKGNSEILAFLEKRRASSDLLFSEMLKNPDAFPKIILGSEVHLTDNLSKCENLSSLRISNTDYILLEMPSSQWTDDDYEEIYKISKLGLRPIIAHLDRYLDWECKFPELLSLNVLFQINAEAFISNATRKKMPNLFMNDAIHVIGSDTHNLTTRTPNLAEAYAIISKKFGQEYVDYLDRSCRSILENRSVSIPKFKKLSFIKKALI